MRIIKKLLLSILPYFASISPSNATSMVACEQFTKVPIEAPTPRDDPHSLERLASINAAVKVRPYPVIFFGDSITERWTSAIWQKELAPQGVLDAGIDGDRTEHLLWRLDHGNLDGTPPEAIVLLIGTNDLGHGRSPEVAAEGIRLNLIHLRERLPKATILLLGLTPRSDRFQGEVNSVNRLIKTCGGGSVVYADIGRTLLNNQGKLTRSLSIDGVHLTDLAYMRLAKQLKPLIQALLR